MDTTVSCFACGNIKVPFRWTTGVSKALASGFRRHAPGRHTDGYQGIEPFAQQVAAFRAGFPDLHVSIDDLLTDGGRLASRTTVTGTHTGDLMACPPPARASALRPSTSDRIEIGQAKECWAASTCTPCSPSSA
jgi:predicted ester cyclase